MCIFWNDAPSGRAGFRIFFIHQQEDRLKRNVLAICDSEQEYAYRLADALSRREDFPFALLTFTGTEKLYESVKERPVQVLLIAQRDFREEMKGWGPRIILLWEGYDSGRTDLPGISKYTSVIRIMKKITETAEEAGSLPPLPRTDHPVRFLGFYTPVGRCLQTTLAFVTGQLLARNHRVLYLNFEPVSGLEHMLARSLETDLSDLLYYLQEDLGAILQRLYRMAETVNGMDVVPPAFSGADILKMGGTEWERLLAVLRESRYEYVILDLSDSVQGLYEVLRSCARIYTVVREDSFAAAKLAQYEEVLKRAEYEDVLQKTKRCRLPLFARLPGDLSHLTGSELAQYAERMLLEDERQGI